MIFLTMNSKRLNSLSLKYQRCTPSGCKKKGFKNLSLWQSSAYLHMLIEQKCPQQERIDKRWWMIRQIFFLTEYLKQNLNKIEKDKENLETK